MKKIVISAVNLVEAGTLAILRDCLAFLSDFANYNVFEFTYSLRNDMPPDLECAMPAMFEREIEQVRSILEMGVENGELKPIDDLMTTARILLISMLGMRLGILKEFKNLFFPPTKEEFDYILDLQRKLSKIFIDGLRK